MTTKCNMCSHSRKRTLVEPLVKFGKVFRLSNSTMSMLMSLTLKNIQWWLLNRDTSCLCFELCMLTAHFERSSFPKLRVPLLEKLQVASRS